MTALEERLVRIGRASVEVDRLRKRKAAASKARNSCRCTRECNSIGGPKRLRVVPACWKNPLVWEGVENECRQCRRRWVRQRAVAAAGLELAGARRRVTVLVRNTREECSPLR